MDLLAGTEYAHLKGMASSPILAEKGNKVVVAFLDGRRLRGYVFNFSPLKDTFRVFPEETPHQGTDVAMKDLKAVFFVRDFAGHPQHADGPVPTLPVHGRKIEVLFTDGEKMTGTTEGYNPQKLGFFVFPSDPKSNDLRVFVVNKNLREVHLL